MNNRIYTAILAGGVLLHSINLYIAITIMPSAISEIGGIEYYAWSTTLYVLSSILATSLSSHLLRKTGAKYAYIIASLFFTLGTLVVAMAPDMKTLLLGRSIEGFGGGLLYAMAYSLTNLLLPKNLWKKTIGIISIMYGISTLIGPAIGGIFAELGRWRDAFYIQIPIALIFTLLIYFLFPKSQQTEKQFKTSKIPYLQLLLLIVSVLSISIGGMTSLNWLRITGFLVGILAVLIIAKIDKISESRLLPKNSFARNNPLAVLYLMIALINASMQVEIYIPYFMQSIHGFTPMYAGYVAVLISFGWTLASLFVARGQTIETGPKITKILRTGPLISLMGLILSGLFLYQNNTDSALQNLLFICFGLILIGFGTGFSWPTITTLVFSNAPKGEQEMASAGMTTVQMMSIALGTALAGMIANLAGIENPGGIEGAQSASIALSTFFSIMAIICLLIAIRIKRAKIL